MRGKRWGRVFQNEKLPGGGQRSLLSKWSLDHFTEQSSTEEAQFQDKRGKITVYTLFLVVERFTSYELVEHRDQ